MLEPEGPWTRERLEALLARHGFVDTGHAVWNAVGRFCMLSDGGADDDYAVFGDVATENAGTQMSYDGVADVLLQCDVESLLRETVKALTAKPPNAQNALRSAREALRRLVGPDRVEPGEGSASPDAGP